MCVAFRCSDYAVGSTTMQALFANTCSPLLAGFGAAVGVLFVVAQPVILRYEPALFNACSGVAAFGNVESPVMGCTVAPVYFCLCWRAVVFAFGDFLAHWQASD